MNTFTQPKVSDWNPCIRLPRWAVPKNEKQLALPKESALPTNILAQNKPKDELLCVYPIAKARGL